MQISAEPSIRSDLEAAIAEAWAGLGRPGSWWSAGERLAIAAQVRAADRCGLCRARAAALSPLAVAGRHDAADGLPAVAIEAIHRIRTDSGRLGEGWYRGLLREGLSDGHYVEIVSIVAVVSAIDSFRRGLGLGTLALPPAVAGLPDRHRPAGTRPGVAWMETLLPADRTSADPNLFRDGPGGRERIGANIHLALSLVPRAMIHWWDLFERLYLVGAMMRDFGREYRAITHAQIELLAARTAALHRCIY